MLKIIAGILIVTASLILGASVSSAYKKRIKFLNDFLDFIAFGEGEIQIYKREMNALIEKYVEGKESDFTLFLRQRFLDSGFSATNADEKLIEEFVTGMEELDSESQKGFINLYKSRVEKNLLEAEKHEKNEGALIKKLLPLGGAALFLIIV